jgi:3D-(3,5/4)-trihydroxycyclohexane-1,2-dione acylhydrolase (decyclizing)
LNLLSVDNGGFAVIEKLQNNAGNESFNNVLSDCPTIPVAFSVDFEAHAASRGATAETFSNPAEHSDVFKRARAGDKTHVIWMKVDANEGWTTKGHGWREVGTPHVSNSARVEAARKDQESMRSRQRLGA